MMHGDLFFVANKEWRVSIVGDAKLSYQLAEPLIVLFTHYVLEVME